MLRFHDNSGEMRNEDLGEVASPTSADGLFQDFSGSMSPELLSAISQSVMNQKYQDAFAGELAGSLNRAQRRKVARQR